MANKNFEIKNGLTIAGTERISSSGAFTGSLASATTATTQSSSDNSTKIATTAYTDAAITAVIGGAPGTLDTLNELAAAINDDASYASTLTTALATKLPLAGGALTGNLSIGDSSSRSFALYVENAGSAGAGQIMLVDSDNDTLQREIRTDAGVLSFDYWDSSNRSNHLTILANGRVGIGTTNPLSKLTIGSSQSDGLEFTYDSSNTYRNRIVNYWNSNTDTRMDFEIGPTGNVAPTAIMSVGYGGNVGIGTTSPDANLEVRTTQSMAFTSDTVDSITIGTSGTNKPCIKFDTADTTHTNRVWAIENGAGGRLNFFRNGLDVLKLNQDGSIEAAGNVGIGTTPSVHYTGYEALDIGNTLSLMSNNTSTNISTLTNNGYLNSNASNWVRKVQDESTMYEQVSGQHRFKSAGSDSAGSAITWLERMRIDSSGKVGIGTDNPTNAKVHIVGDSSYVGDYGYSTLVLEDSSGYAGLNLRNGNNNWLMRNAGNNNSLQIVSSSNASGPGTGTYTPRLVIMQAGNVGIGTDNPSDKLEVSGTGGTRLKVTNTDTNWAGLDLQAGGNQANYLFFRDESAERSRIMATDGGEISFQTGASPVQRLKISTNDIVMGTGTVNESAKIISSGGTTVIRAADSNHSIVLRGTQDASGNITGNTNTMGFYEYGGYEFYTKQGNSRVKSLDMPAGGKVFITTSAPRSKYFDVNGVAEISEAFTLNNGIQYDFDYTVGSEGGAGNSYFIIAGYNHFYNTSYGAHKVAFMSARTTNMATMIDLGDQTSTGGGAWQFSKPTATTLRIRKTAGTYTGGGYGFIKVFFRNI